MRSANDVSQARYMARQREREEQSLVMQGRAPTIPRIDALTLSTSRHSLDALDATG